MARVLAEKINETAAPQDVVTGEGLSGRVRAKELGRERTISCHSDRIENTSSQQEPEARAPDIRTPQPSPKAETNQNSNAMSQATTALVCLWKIKQDDPKRRVALSRVRR